MGPPRIAIVTDDPGWHGARLREAFAARGADSAFVSLLEARLELGGPPGGCPVRLPGFEEAPPAGVFVRGVPGGTLEQVTLRLDALHLLREWGVPVCNDGRAIERTVDKAMTSALLWRAGVPTPPTWVCESQAQARAVVERETAGGGELVYKPLFGSQGEGLLRVPGPEALPSGELARGTWYLQAFVPGQGEGYRDWRVLVVGGRAVAAMCRRSAHWVTNRAQGARCEPCELTAELRRLAEAAASAVGVDYAGVDLLREAGGRFLVGEVNGVPAWHGLQSVSGLDLAGLLADHLLARLPTRAALGRLA